MTLTNGFTDGLDKARENYQRRCQVCGLWTIWTHKLTGETHADCLCGELEPADTCCECGNSEPICRGANLPECDLYDKGLRMPTKSAEDGPKLVKRCRYCGRFIVRSDEDRDEWVHVDGFATGCAIITEPVEEDYCDC